MYRYCLDKVVEYFNCLSYSVSSRISVVRFACYNHAATKGPAVGRALMRCTINPTRGRITIYWSTTSFMAEAFLSDALTVLSLPSALAGKALQSNITIIVIIIIKMILVIEMIVTCSDR